MNVKEIDIIVEAARRNYFLSYYDPAKGGQLLEEQLVPANLNDLEVAMQNDKGLHTFLNTPARDLPDNYKYLVQEIPKSNENVTLLTVIKISLSYEGVITPYFSKAGSKICGFVGYQVNGDEVSDIKMFSFDPSRGGGATLLWDLHGLLKKLVEQYSKITWSAMAGNPANDTYQKAVGLYGGTCKEEGGVIYYSIEKSNNKNNQ